MDFELRMWGITLKNECGVWSLLARWARSGAPSWQQAALWQRTGVRCYKGWAVGRSEAGRVQKSGGNAAVEVYEGAACQRSEAADW
jgi:hypothetical protein